MDPEISEQLVNTEVTHPVDRAYEVSESSSSGMRRSNAARHHHRMDYSMVHYSRTTPRETFGQVLSNTSPSTTSDNVFQRTRASNLASTNATTAQQITNPLLPLSVGELGYALLTDESVLSVCLGGGAGGGGGNVWFPHADLFQIGSDFANGSSNVVDTNNAGSSFNIDFGSTPSQQQQYDRRQDVNHPFYLTFPDLVDQTDQRMIQQQQHAAIDIAYQQNEADRKPRSTQAHHPNTSSESSNNQWMVSLAEMPLSNGPSIDQYSQETNEETTPKGTPASRSRPDIVKDERYWMRRKKNNAAAKRSRDNRRQKENATAEKAKRQEIEIAELLRTNSELQQRLASVKSEFHRCPRCGYIAH